MQQEAHSLLQELKRRRVFRAVIGYGIAAFAVLQVVEPIMHGLHWPEAVLSYVVVGLALGFPLVVGLAWIFDVNAGRIERTAPPPASHLRGPRLAFILVGLGLLAAAPGLAWYLLRHPAGTAAPAEPQPSIAVLPLVNLSSDREQEYFSDGMSEELLNLLAQVPGLRVAARTSSFAFKGKNEDVTEIGRSLHVGSVLEGSVRKAGDRIRITTQLINATSGYHLWSETYDRKLSDVFAVQDEIAKAVVAALRMQLLPPSARRTANPDAYNQYLLGRQFFLRNNVDGWRRAKAAYGQSVKLDPGYAPAWAGLALSMFWVADSQSTNAAYEAGLRGALEAANQAVTLDPALPAGYLARAFVGVPLSWDWESTRRDFERALSLKPDDPDALSEYAMVYLRATGHLQEAVAALRKASAADPLNARIWGGLGGALGLIGETDAAAAAFTRSFEISPDQSFTAYNFALTYLVAGRPAEALAVSQRSTNEVFRLAGAAQADLALGHKREAQKALDELIQRWGQGAAYQIAQVYGSRGEPDRAFEWLDRAVKQRDGGLVNLKPDPTLRGLHRDPRWAALLQRMHLPAEER